MFNAADKNRSFFKTKTPSPVKLDIQHIKYKLKPPQDQNTFIYQAEYLMHQKSIQVLFLK